jgi:RNA polymerase sigma-70 factor, ECF subfamily
MRRIPMTDANRSDRELVDRLVDGSEEAFEFFVDQYYPRLYRFAYLRVASDPEVTQDVVQGTFEKVIPNLGSYRGEAALFTWLCTFCRYEIAAYWKRRGKMAPEVALVEDAPAVRAALDSLAALAEGSDAIVARRELARLVRTTLDRLPVHYGNALDWKYIQDLPVAEIAKRLGISDKAAESVLTRARQAFRDGFGAVAGGLTR